MKPSYKSAILVFAAAAMMLMLTFSTNPYTDSRMAQLIARANSYYLQFPQEKVYLHLDRSSYWASDDIWFKAYLKDSPTQNCNLYVELLNSSGTIVAKKKYWAQNGLAYGDFHLSDTISTGIYQVRAYTNWMRNFDDRWFFRKDLVIWSLKDQKINQDKRQLRENKIDIQFFPEGGTFVAGLKSKMGFKAADQNGKGLDVEGRIVDDLDNVVAEFKSDFKGLGNFILQPREGRKYEAQVVVAGQIEMSVNLPSAQAEGVVMEVNSHENSQLHFQLSRKSIAPAYHSPAEYILLGQSKGFVCYRKNISLGKEPFDLEIQKNELPTGIVQFTLFDKDVIPVCERLVFINHHDRVDIEISPDKESYRTREEVRLHIVTAEGALPVKANLSMSVFNPDAQLEMEDYPNNILTHFLLGSELKGLIEQPAYYFKDDSLSTVLALDNLMLTHGYRHFEWKEIREDKFPQITYPAEECIQVRGIVKSILFEKPVPDCRVTMVSLKGLFKFYQVTTDSLGQFLFSNLYFNDTIPFTLQALNKRGKMNSWLELDKRSSVSPRRSYLPVTYQYSKENPIQRKSYLSEVDNDFIKRKWRLSDTIMISEVKVVKSKYKFGERPMRLHEKADYELELDLDDDELGNVFHNLEDQFPNVIVKVFQEGNVGLSGGGMEGHRAWDVLHIEENSRVLVKVDYQEKGPVFVLDGSVVDMDLICKIPQGAFDRVEILKNGAVYGQFEGGAVCFFTKRGAFAPMPNSTGMKSSSIIGYSVIRKFYSPDYAVPLPTEIKDDFRSTLYWDPLVRTDSLGRTNVSFYNSDQPGEVKVIVEGITKEGKICRGVYKYHVVPK